MAKCGKCHVTGVDVAHVRSCYGLATEVPRQVELPSRMSDHTHQVVEAQQAVDVLDKLADDGPKETGPNRDRQIRYALSLLEERVWPDKLDEDDLRAMERRQVSRLIDSLTNAPRKETHSWPNVPEGRYAILNTHPIEKDGTGAGNDWSFYQVDAGKGKWKGRTFVNQLLGSGGDFQRAPVYGARATKVLVRIKTMGIKESLLKFGQEIGECGVCRSPLTNEESRRLGIGPICRAKKGW